MSDKFKVKIPTGYIMVEAKGTEDEYPGVYVSFSESGENYNTGDMIACVEYDSGTGEIKTEAYEMGMEEPTHIICYEDGRNVL